MKQLEDLESHLRRIDGRSYGAYRDIQGDYAFDAGTLHIDTVQRDPFAPPSKLRVRIPATAARLPRDLFDNPIRKIALADFLARRFRSALANRRVGEDSGNSGSIEIDAGGQEVLQRTAVALTSDWVEARISVGLPAAGRSVLGEKAQSLLCHELLQIAHGALSWEMLPQDDTRAFVDCIDNQEYIRSQLDGNGLVTFVADGSILPRASGIDAHPLSALKAVPFKSPSTLRVTLALLHPQAQSATANRTKQITGMGIPKGVTLIVGGGYHGKSTLLRALQDCVVPHIPGDGREFVASLRSGIKIRAEDGRRVEGVDIRPFIRDLPTGKTTANFRTENASGSTSQAANIAEALEISTTLLLLDEDTSATNFMIRDARMQELIPAHDEPITPFLHRVRELAENFDVSTVLVTGGSGDYFEVADLVIRMDAFAPIDVTQEALAIVSRSPENTACIPPPKIHAFTQRVPHPKSFDASRGRREVKIDAKAIDELNFGQQRIDLRYWEQLFDRSQTRAVGYAIHWLARHAFDEPRTLSAALGMLEEALDRDGLAILCPFRHGEAHPGNLARPRIYDVAAAINRLRSLQVDSAILEKSNPRQEEEK